MDSGSGSEQAEEKSGNEQESTEQPPKKKRYHRHTARQIQEMEAYFSFTLLFSSSQNLFWSSFSVKRD